MEKSEGRKKSEWRVVPDDIDTAVGSAEASIPRLRLERVMKQHREQIPTVSSYKPFF